MRNLNNKLGYSNCNGGSLIIPIDFRNKSTVIKNSQDTALEGLIDTNGWIKVSKLTIGETYSIETIINGQTIKYTFTYNGWSSDGPLLEGEK